MYKRQRYVQTGSYLSDEEDELIDSETLKDTPADRVRVHEDGANQPGLFATQEAVEQIGEAHTSAELLEEQIGREVDAPLCLTCGTKMRPSGSCYVCEGCGSTSGCS